MDDVPARRACSGIAMTGLLAAFMAGVAANVTSFNTVVTYDLSQPYFAKDRDDEYYLRMGRLVTVGGILIVGRHGVHRQGLLEHHELHPAAVLVLQRAAVRHVHHRHVLAPRDAVGRLLGPGRRHAGGVRHAPRCTPSATHRPRLRRWRASFWGAIVAFLADAVVTVGRLAGHAAQAGGGAARARLGARPRGRRARRMAEARRQAWYRSPALLGGVRDRPLVILNIIFI